MSRLLGTVHIDGFPFYVTVPGRAPSSRPAVPAASPPGPEPVERDVVGALREVAR